MKYKLKKILTFLTINPVMKFLFQFDLRLVSFFSDNKAGYIFYLFCVLYGFFGCSGNNCTVSHFCAAIFVIFTATVTLQTYLLVQIPFTRAYLENLLGIAYIEKYFGKYNGSEVLIKLAKHTAPILVLCLTEYITANSEAARCYEASNSVIKNFNEFHSDAGSQPSMEERKAIMKESISLIHKAVDAKGLVSKGVAAIGLGR